MAFFRALKSRFSKSKSKEVKLLPSERLAYENICAKLPEGRFVYVYRKDMLQDPYNQKYKNFIRIVNEKNFSIEWELLVENQVSNLVTTRTGLIVFAFDYGSQIFIYDPISKNLIKTIDINGKIFSLLCTDHHLIVNNKNGCLYVYDIKRWDLLHSAEQISAVAMKALPSGNIVLSNDTGVHIFNPNLPKNQLKKISDCTQVRMIDVFSDGRVLLGIIKEFMFILECIKILNLENGNEISSPCLLEQKINFICVLPNQDIAANCATQQKGIFLSINEAKLTEERSIEVPFSRESSSFSCGPLFDLKTKEDIELFLTPVEQEKATIQSCLDPFFPNVINRLIRDYHDFSISQRIVKELHQKRINYSKFFSSSEEHKKDFPSIIFSETPKPR